MLRPHYENYNSRPSFFNGDTDNAPYLQRFDKPPPRARNIPLMWKVAGTVLVTFIAFVVVSAILTRDELQYDGIAHPVDMSNSLHRMRLRQTVQMLTLMMADNVCLACPHERVALQCIVWNDGTVWTNPVVIKRSEEEIAGYEIPFMGTDEDRRLVQQSAYLEVVHDGDILEKVTGGAAHCVDFSIGLFDGSTGILALP